jgi:hypothetical protein
MPRKAIEYEKTVIYKFVCNDLNITDVYIGSTTDFSKRKNSHKSRCINENNKKYHLKIYQTIRENGGWDNWKMIEIEKYKCNDGNDARARERYWYEILNANMNIQVPNRTLQEYLDDNKTIISEKAKKTYICDCGSICRIGEKSRHNKTIKHLEYIKK